MVISNRTFLLVEWVSPKFSEVRSSLGGGKLYHIPITKNDIWDYSVVTTTLLK